MIRELGSHATPHGSPLGHYLNGNPLRNPADLAHSHDADANQKGREYRRLMLAKHPKEKLMGGSR